MISSFGTGKYAALWRQYAATGAAAVTLCFNRLRGGREQFDGVVRLSVIDMLHACAGVSPRTASREEG